MTSWAATKSIDVILALSESRYSGYRGYIHLFEDCPAVKRGIKRDGGYCHHPVTHADLSALLDARQWCGVCRRRTP